MSITRRKTLVGVAVAALLCAVVWLGAAVRSEPEVRLTFLCLTNNVASHEVSGVFMVENRLKQNVAITGAALETRARGWRWHSAASFEPIGIYPPGRTLLVAEVPWVEGRYRLVLPWYPAPWVEPPGARLRLRLTSFLQSHGLLPYKWQWRLSEDHFVESNPFQVPKDPRSRDMQLALYDSEQKPLATVALSIPKDISTNWCVGQWRGELSPAYVRPKDHVVLASDKLKTGSWCSMHCRLDPSHAHTIRIMLHPEHPTSSDFPDFVELFIPSGQASSPLVWNHVADAGEAERGTVEMLRP